MPGTPFAERDQARQPTPWKSWGMSGGLKSFDRHAWSEPSTLVLVVSAPFTRPHARRPAGTPCGAVARCGAARDVVPRSIRSAGAAGSNSDRRRVGYCRGQQDHPHCRGRLGHAGLLRLNHLCHRGRASPGRQRHPCRVRLGHRVCLHPAVRDFSVRPGPRDAGEGTRQASVFRRRSGRASAKTQRPWRSPWRL